LTFAFFLAEPEEDLLDEDEVPEYEL
jgi:hypothetical protein